MISAPFAAFLEAERPALNQRVLEARRRFPDFDTQAFSSFLVDAVDALVSAAPPERAHAVAMAADELALDITGLKLIGSQERADSLLGVWHTIARALMPVLAAHPAQVLRMLSNAVIHLESQPGILIEQWIKEMAALAPSIASVPQLEAVGEIAAWRAGMAHFRTGALSAGGTLPAALACAAVGAPAQASWDATLKNLARDPWWSPGAPRPMRRSIGCFAGLGGAFIAPPTVRPYDHGFVVRSGEHYFLLLADTFGAVLLAAGRDDFDAAPQATLPGQRWAAELQLPAEGLTVCSNGHTLAIASPYTHAIALAAAA